MSKFIRIVRPAVSCPAKTFITVKALCYWPSIRAVPMEMSCLSTAPAGIIRQESLWESVVGSLPVVKQGIKKGSQGHYGAYPRVTGSSGQYLFIKINIIDCYHCFAVGSIKTLPYQLFNKHVSSGSTLLSTVSVTLVRNFVKDLPDCCMRFQK